MSVLYFLESLRCPPLDLFFGFVTRFGEELLFLGLGLFIFWCRDKKEGYYLLLVGTLGNLINQVLKMHFRIPRPWVKDPQFTIVESAREAATGYSFPSGHTQSSVGGYGGIARWEKHKWLRWLCIALCVLVPVSRLYLGVHTPLDVLVGAAVSVLLLLVLHPLVRKGDKYICALLLGGFVCSLLAAVFLFAYPFPTDVDGANLFSARLNACKLIGVFLGLNLVHLLDQRYIHFEPRAPLKVQLVKLLLGGILVIGGLKLGIGELLKVLLGRGYAYGVLSYFILVLGVGLWPLSFPLLSKLYER